MPGTLVAIERVGPPVLVPGLGSQLSNWLSPPCMLNTTTRISATVQLAGTYRTGQTPQPTSHVPRPAERPQELASTKLGVPQFDKHT